MITEHHEHIPDDYMVSVQPVRPWTRYPECPKCGGSLGYGVRVVGVLLGALGRCAQNYVYCKGDQNSTAMVPAFDPAKQEINFAHIKIPCFGIIQEHLHLSCSRCSFQWLMECKTGKEK